MSKQTINIGASPNDGTGTPLRTSFDYTNQNFTELYTALGGGVGLPGATTQVIFNDGGTNLAGDAGLVYNKTTDALTVAGLVTAGSATITGAATVGTTLGVTGVSTFAAGTALLPALTTTGDTNTGIYYPAADTFAVSTGGTERYRVNASGVLLVGRTSALSAETFSSVGFALIGGATHQAIIGEASGNVFAGSFTNTAFRIRTNNTEVAQFDASGNVGIGVTPSAWAAGGNIQGTNGFIWSSYDASIGAGYYYASSSYKYISTAAASIYSPFGGTHKWFTAAGGQPAGTNFTPTQAMTLDASGNLLVGLTTSFAQPSRFVVESNSQTTAICGIFNDARTDSASAINIAFYRNGIKVGSVDCTNAATSYVTSSDYRLKEDVQPLSGGLARVSALKPSIYKWKINGSNGEGFIAHELAEVVPAAVTGEKDAVNKDGTVNPQGVDLSKVVPILVAAIQELTARVQTLEAR